MIGIAHGVRHAGIRHAGDEVHVGHAAALGLVARHDRAVAIAHQLDVHALVVGVRIAVIGPQKGADLHLLARRRERFKAARVQADDLAGSKLVGVLIVELVVGEGFKRDAVAVLALPDQHREASHAVSCCNELPLLGQKQDRHGAVDSLLRVENAGDKVILLIDERGGQLRDIHAAAAQRQKLLALVGEVVVHQLVGVVDDADRHDGVQAQMGAHEQRLRVAVADAAEPRVAAEVREVPLKLRPKGRIFNVVYLALEALLLVKEHHSAAARAEVRMIVRAEEDIQRDIAVRDRAEKAPHYAKNSSESVMGSMYFPSR